MSVQVSARVDEATKRKFDGVCEAIGVSPSNAISMFISGVINYNGIPFSPVARPQPDHSAPKEKSSKMSRQEMSGCMSGKIWMSDDFDASLEDFREYME